MKKGTSGDLPQIVSIMPVKAGGKLRLVKKVKDYLGLQAGGSLYLDMDDEVRLTVHASLKPELAISSSGIIVLPEVVLRRLNITGPVMLGLVQRPDAVAVKVVEIHEVIGDRVRLSDIETLTKIVRRVEVLPSPDDLIPKLLVQLAELNLQYDVKSFVKDGQNLVMWTARQMLDCALPSDTDLCESLIAERIASQEEDGSWSESVILTARNLRELAKLGVDKSLDPVRCAVEWLLNRSRSTHNPGMFFATDALVEEQADVMVKRNAQKHGSRPRFRQIKTSEKKHVMSGDDLIYAPCGPRIMWPNGLTIEALLALGCKETERVQTALETLSSQDWCECGYQNGAGAGMGRKPLTEEQLAAFEATCMTQYRYGGLRDIQELMQADMAHRSSAMRIAQVPQEGDNDQEEEYLLGIENHIQGCEFITTRSLSHVKDARLRRFAEAHLWRFASRQYTEDGTFPSERYGTGFHQAGILQAVARYDHPVSKVIVLRSLPWIVQNQNEDGSWGGGARKEAETLAVIYALLSLGELIPANLAEALAFKAF